MTGKEPLLPPEVDLRDFAFMPLDVVRLRDSDLAATSTSDEFRAAVMLWCAAWHQIPAASLPDDDRVLSQLAGFGRVVKEWQRVRDGAMRGWVLCTDGRLYHPVIVEKAAEAWQAKLRQRWGSECARIKKHNQRHEAANVPCPSFAEWISDGCLTGHPLPVPRDNDASPPDNGGDNGSKGQGEGQGQGEKKERETSLRSVGAPSGASPPAEDRKKSQGKPGRLPDGWSLPMDWRDRAIAKGMLPEAADLAGVRFGNFYKAMAGKSAIKADWSLMWDNWFLKEIDEKPQSRKPHAPDKTPDGVWLAFDSPEFEAWKIYRKKAFSKVTTHYHSAMHSAEGNYFPAQWPPNLGNGATAA